MEVSVAGILVTHTHYDHIGAVADLAETTGAPVYISEVEAPVLARPDDYYPGHRIRPWDTVVGLSGDEQIDLAGISFETVNVPGHSPGHVAFYADLSPSPGTCCSPARSVEPICRWRLGHAGRVDRRLVDAFRPRRSSTQPWAATTPGAELPAIRSSQSSAREVRSPARHDIPSEQPRWRQITDGFEDLCRLYGYRRIDTPVFEDTWLFGAPRARADIVAKGCVTAVATDR
jgi:hypothetical protein